MVVSDILEQIGHGRETVPLPEVARAINMPRGTREVMIRDGAIKPCSGGGKGRAHLLPWDEVVLLVTAAVFAAAAGIAITVALRVLRGSGAQVTPAGITIPFGMSA